MLAHPGYAEHEFCHLLEGRVVPLCRSATGERWEISASGDSFVVPAGFTGTWEVIEDCRKVYAIFEARVKSKYSAPRCRGRGVRMHTGSVSSSIEGRLLRNAQRAVVSTCCTPLV